jgi:hypothetical protein
LKAGSNLNVNSELTLKESFHHGVAVPLSLDDYEKELAREKDLLNKAKKKISMESSTPKEGISTWILLSGSSDLKTSTTTSRPEVAKPAYRNDNAEKKNVVKNNITNNSTAAATTKKRVPVTQSPKTTKPTQKVSKLITRVKVSAMSEQKNATEIETSTLAHTTKKALLTTKAKKYTTTKKTPATTTTTTVAPKKIIDDSMVIDDEKDEPEVIETSTYLIMEAKDDEFNLPNDRAPIKSTSNKKVASKSGTTTKNKKKKTTTPTTIATSATNSTKIKKKSDKIKTGLTKVSKKPEKPITTQIYNYLAREVMPTVGVGLVGLVVTAGLATYFLGGPLTALRRSYDIASRRDDVAYDRSDDFGNMQDEGEMFGKVIAGMPENSAYRNNIRNSYRVKGAPQYTPGAYPAAQQQYTHVSKYGLQAQPVQPAHRYRAADPYYNSYSANNQLLQQQNQYQQYQQQQMQGKSNDYSPQTIQAETGHKFNIDAVDMTTSEPSSSSYSMDYDEIAQSYFPQPDQSEQQMTVEKQNIEEVDSKPQPQYVQPSDRSEKVTIVNAQSVVVPSNHKVENDESNALPTPEALRMTSTDDEYQNSIANAILSQTQKQKQFVVGTSIIAENFEDNAASSVPEHGPRRRRKREVKKPAAKSLENNEIDEDVHVSDNKNKRQTEEETQETTTAAAAESSTHEISTGDLDENNETTTPLSESTTPLSDINGGNNVFQLFRRIIELKLRLGLNFLQNATLAFQEYLKGVEERVQTSPLFNVPTNETSASASDLSRKASKDQRKKVENL